MKNVWVISLPQMITRRGEGKWGQGSRRKSPEHGRAAGGYPSIHGEGKMTLSMLYGCIIYHRMADFVCVCFPCTMPTIYLTMHPAEGKLETGEDGAPARSSPPMQLAR
jgi:hypothetical protein